MEKAGIKIPLKEDGLVSPCFHNHKHKRDFWDSEINEKVFTYKRLVPTTCYEYFYKI